MRPPRDFHETFMILPQNFCGKCQWWNFDVRTSIRKPSGLRWSMTARIIGARGFCFSFHCNTFQIWIDFESLSSWNANVGGDYSWRVIWCFTPKKHFASWNSCFEFCFESIQWIPLGGKSLDVKMRFDVTESSFCSIRFSNRNCRHQTTIDFWNHARAHWNRNMDRTVRAPPALTDVAKFVDDERNLRWWSWANNVPKQIKSERLKFFKERNSVNEFCGLPDRFCQITRRPKSGAYIN